MLAIASDMSDQMALLSERITYYSMDHRREWRVRVEESKRDGFGCEVQGLKRLAEVPLDCADSSQIPD